MWVTPLGLLAEITLQSRGVAPGGLVLASSGQLIEQVGDHNCNPTERSPGRLGPSRLRRSQLGLRGLDDPVCGEAEFPLEILERRRGPVGPHADALARGPDVLRPAED